MKSCQISSGHKNLVSLLGVYTNTLSTQNIIIKTILITGANKGIGFETARQLAQQSFFIYLGSRDKVNGEEAVKKLNDIGITNVETLTIDVADIDSVRQARQELEVKIDSLDILINNAGISGDMPQDFVAGDMANLRKIFDTNFFGVVQTTQEFLPLLKKSAQAAIINVSSEVGSLALRQALVLCTGLNQQAGGAVLATG